MASVTSLGLHRPIGLSYLVQEGLLSAEPSSDSYTWVVVDSEENSGVQEADEIISTKSCVVWCSGGVVRKSFRFEIEDEPVTQALLTYFTSEISQARSNTSKPSPKPKPESADQEETHIPPRASTAPPTPHTRSRALVVFLRTQAHIYFLTGTSHVIHLPFEVEHVSAAPNGLIIQRKPNTDRLLTATFQIPGVPPNSFKSSQPQGWSAASSIQSTFSIASLGSPQQLNLPRQALLENLWKTPQVKDDSKWPRLFCLTDPLAEMGLVATDLKLNGSRRLSAKSLGLDPAEELIHITNWQEFSSIQSLGSDPLILAVTMNSQTNAYTVWRAHYAQQEEAMRHKPVLSSSSATRRRSSFAPGGVSGTTTPAVTGQYAFRESVGAPTGNANLRAGEGLTEELLDFATALDPEFEDKGMPRRKSRRVSSFLARGDLSTSHDRGAFHELGTSHQHQSKRRGESLGGQHVRQSLGQSLGLSGLNGNPQVSDFGISLNSLLAPAPVDDLLDELRAGGDFEGFHNMGLDDEDFEGLRKEMTFAKIESLPVQRTNLRFSSQDVPVPLRDQHNVFTLAAPKCASEDPRRSSIIVCIHDNIEKNLLIIPLDIGIRSDSSQPQNSREKFGPLRHKIAITASKSKRVGSILDACRLTDGEISRILILTESSDGKGDLTLQAPWSTLCKVSIPTTMAVSNMRSIGHDATPQKRREGGFKRVLSDGIRSMRSLRHTSAGGRVDIVDDDGKVHQLQILMEPRNALVKNVISVCRSVLPGQRGGEAILILWWNVRQWLSEISHPQMNDEWSALVVVLFTIMLGLHEQHSKDESPGKPRTARSHTRSSSLLSSDDDIWRSMISVEASNSGYRPAWMLQTPWQWLDEEGLVSVNLPETGHALKQKSNVEDVEHTELGLQSYVDLTRRFLRTQRGNNAFAADCDGYMPTARHHNIEFRANVITDLLTGLHLFREEQKLDVTTVDSLVAGSLDLTPILSQMYRWVGWKTWAAVYNAEDIAMSSVVFDNTKLVALPEPPRVPDIYQWIESCFVAKRLGSFVTIADITLSRSAIDHQNAPHTEIWSTLTPRTSLFMDFFSHIVPTSSAIDIVEALHIAGLTTQVLETLPEAVLVPLRESIVSCQDQPSISWGRDVLSLVDRADVGLLLSPESHKSRMYSPVLAPSHEASIDFHGVCHSTQEVETVGSFDGSAEVDRQAITRLIFKDDQRFSEAASILNTTKPKLARVEPQPGWSESDLLEAQKEHVVMLATRTLAIPTGRGLLYFSARIPLLTEKFPIGGFNLHCIMKPSNSTVGVEKMNFTEEKVCWAFFHSGVSAGLSISRDARGIDTSWILYNKPQDNSNRHAGFLLALGLNGHLKTVAKWVAFKYLTPKHPMTSIGLLLGLAASFLGTMDSSITRVVSVHVTRMLPPGSAELNLSPLTQTAGIMSIGLLYCHTQHRRMSEIMLSEVEHIEPEIEDEPLRNEGYRLASGLALGFINLGKGSDLRGLHDMHLIERLLRIAVGSKKVDVVHILDKSTAAAILAIALIFMKSGNLPLARKIDVPESMLQYDYVRPDMFLLRTLARQLIMWNDIRASSAWMKQMLPKSYQYKSDLTSIHNLMSEDLPFYNIVTGLLFSVALRHAGSGSLHVRDLMLHYLDQMSRICKLTAVDFDQKLTRNTVRNCLDLIALSAATVMAGTGDIPTFRRLRTLHGRDDVDTPYGSHLAAHMAIGALFLGGGTQTFGYSNLAIASLIISFYPIFPTSILDNKSHLQAFRHFWVLATEPRCLVPRDLDTNRPVTIPMRITLKTGVHSDLHAPCLLPDLSLISNISTSSQEYWNVVLDFGSDKRVHTMFNSNQTIWVRRKQMSDSGMPTYQATLQALDITSSVTSSIKSSQPLEWIFNLQAFTNLTKSERTLMLGPIDGASSTGLGMETTVVDTRLVLEKGSLMSGKRDRLQGLKLLFAWQEAAEKRGETLKWLSASAIDGLKARVWLLGNENEEL